MRKTKSEVLGQQKTYEMTATAGKYFVSVCSTVSPSFARTIKLTFSASTSDECIAFVPSCSMVIVGFLQTRQKPIRKTESTMKTSQAHFYSHQIFIVQIGNVGYHSVIIVSSLPDSHLLLYESETKSKKKLSSTPIDWVIK